MGTSHGAYKFSRKPTGDILAMDVIEEIHAKLPNTHLVMHGSSSVPEEFADIINEYGGEMPQTWGVPVEEIVGIKHGVRKINIDTDLRLAAAAEFRRVANKNKAEFDPRKFLKPAMDAMKVCRDRFEAFGCAGQAAHIKVKPMSEMAGFTRAARSTRIWTRRPPPEWRATARHYNFPKILPDNKSRPAALAEKMEKNGPVRSLRQSEPHRKAADRGRQARARAPIS